MHGKSCILMDLHTNDGGQMRIVPRGEANAELYLPCSLSLESDASLGIAFCTPSVACMPVSFESFGSRTQCRSVAVMWLRTDAGAIHS